MSWIRGVGATILLVLGMVLLAGGFFVTVGTLMQVLKPGVTLDVGTVAGGAGAILLGLGSFWASRAVGGENGPIKDYRERRGVRRRAARP